MITKLVMRGPPSFLRLSDPCSRIHPSIRRCPNTFSVIFSQIPWALRDLIANEVEAHFFRSDFANLRNAFPDWHPKTAILRDMKRKLQPIQRLNMNLSMGSSLSTL